MNQSFNINFELVYIKKKHYLLNYLCIILDWYQNYYFCINLQLLL
jgi:hypothetical protein